jgi:hypothetical protein
LAVTKSPADTEALPAFLASNCSLIVMGIRISLLISDNDSCVSDHSKDKLAFPSYEERELHLGA